MYGLIRIRNFMYTICILMGYISKIKRMIVFMKFDGIIYIMSILSLQEVNFKRFEIYIYMHFHTLKFDTSISFIYKLNLIKFYRDDLLVIKKITSSLILEINLIKKIKRINISQILSAKFNQWRGQ